jgi:hypothetical protein
LKKVALRMLRRSKLNTTRILPAPAKTITDLYRNKKIEIMI